MKALKKSLKTRGLIAGLNSLIGVEFRSAGQAKQPQCGVAEQECDLARHPEVNLNLFTKVGILNESPNQSLQCSITQIYLLMSRS